MERPSSFSVTCNRLSQFLRENGGLGLAPRPQEPPTTKGVFRPPVTMSLLPGAVISADDDPDETETETEGGAAQTVDLFPQRAGKGADAKNQLTIFYGGEVMVFDDFPADKAKELMLMVGQGSSTTASAVVQDSTQSRRTGQPTAYDVPPARRASLHRFLEKRKDRISSKAPYQVISSSLMTPVVDPTKAEIARQWLGLGQSQQVSMPAMMSSESRR